jgi:hypothetical protein
MVIGDQREDMLTFNRSLVRRCSRIGNPGASITDAAYSYRFASEIK